MVNVPSTSDAAEKFSRRASQAGQDYQTGVQNSSDQEQQQATLEARERWAQGVQDAISNDSFGRGVQNTTKSWQQEALEVGSSRFTQGAQRAQNEYAESVQPFFDALESLTLSPRGPRGSPENYERSSEVGRRLHELRTQG
jgi:hypothetical protein